MTLQMASALQDAILDTIETHIGTAPLLKAFTGSPPAGLGDADTGTLLFSMILPSDFMNAASGNSKTKLGTWEDQLANASGDAGYFRIYTSGGVAKIQGTITATGGGGDMTMPTITVTANEYVVIGVFTLAAGNS